MPASFIPESRKKTEFRTNAGDEIICSEKVSRTEEEIEENPGSTLNLLSLDQKLQYSCSLKRKDIPELTPAGNHDYMSGSGSFTISKIVPPSSKNNAETVMIKFNKKGRCFVDKEGKESLLSCKTEYEFIDPKDLGSIGIAETIKETIKPSERKGLSVSSKFIIMKDYDPKETLVECMTKRKQKDGNIIPKNSCVVGGSTTLKVPTNMNRVDLSGNMSFFIIDGFAANVIRNRFRRLTKEEQEKWKEENKPISKTSFQLSAGWPLFIMIPENSTDVTCKVNRFSKDKKIVAKELKCINSPIVASPESKQRLIESLDIAKEKTLESIL